MAYRTEAILMTLSDLQGHSCTASVFKCGFLNSCFRLHIALCGASVIAELLYCLCHLQQSAKRIYFLSTVSRITHCVVLYLIQFAKISDVYHMIVYYAHSVNFPLAEIVWFSFVIP